MKKYPYELSPASAIAVYDRKTEKFHYSPELSQMFTANFDERDLWRILSDDDITSKMTADRLRESFDSVASSPVPHAEYLRYYLRSADRQYSYYMIGFVSSGTDSGIAVTFTKISIDPDSNISLTNRFDELTGLYTRKAFTEKLQKMVSGLNDENKYMVIYFDVQRFKAINDMYGMTEGDRLLIHIADVISRTTKNCGFGCRIGSDRFACVLPYDDDSHQKVITDLLNKVSSYDLPFEITCNAGVYVIKDLTLSSVSIVDRAILAQSTIKGSYTIKYKLYNEELRETLLTEQEITGIMSHALEDKQFIVYYQPQYNHSTGMLVGAEALVRWLHPERGLVPPNRFIPIFEKNGFITKLDLYVFDCVCAFIRKCLDNNIPVVPISTNLTRFDIFSPDFIENLELSRKKHNVPSKYIRVEITESAALGNSKFINDAVSKLHSFGYVVEMDDFGSGYSSLNILKDIDFDIIKLDMRFLQSENDKTNRGGTILSSVVRMINWLNLPVIAEGVETVHQADFLRSIGCYYIQGYLYSKPLPQEQYEQLVSGSNVGTILPNLSISKKLNIGNIWSIDSLETLIFNNFVGGAALFEYQNGIITVLRVNRKYLSEFGMNMSEKEVLHVDALSVFDDENKKIYLDTLHKVIETESEQECETWRKITSLSCGSDNVCIRSMIYLIGKSSNSSLFCATVRNITTEKKYIMSVADSEKNFKYASDQAKIFFWEYTVSTKTMRPCFRCMRDLKLPPLVENYPEPVIEMGIFPQDYADMYRDWHKQIANGVKELEAIIPLTAERIPYRVRYTTEFDENGRPIKAYGSATPVVEQ